MAKKADERSESGEPIYRYGEHEPRPFELAIGDEAASAPVEAAMQEAYGTAATVWHEIISDLVHIDVHVIAPTSASPHYTLFTTGMSSRPMAVPEGAEDFRYAELVLKLPGDWPFPEKPFAVSHSGPGADDSWYWPVGWMKLLARFPHENATWFGEGHTLPNGDPAEPLVSKSDLCGWLMFPDATVAESARSVVRPDGARVHFYVLHALTKDEMELKLAKGVDAILERFDATDYSDVLDPMRRSTLRRKIFGLF